MSRTIPATIRGGAAVSAELSELRDGERVDVVTHDDALSPDDLAELAAANAEADRGDAFVSADEVIEGLRARHAAARR